MIAELIEPLIHALVDNPSAVTVEEKVILAGKKVSIVVLAPKSDLGKLVGKNGTNAKAFRSLLSSLSGRHRCTYTLEIEEGGVP